MLSKTYYFCSVIIFFKHVICANPIAISYVNHMEINEAIKDVNS